jgi:hypothetical protein
VCSSDLAELTGLYEVNANLRESERALIARTKAAEAALNKIADIHSRDLIGAPDSGLYACCMCGRSDEYPVDWPCETHSLAALDTKPDNSDLDDEQELIDQRMDKP